MQIWFNVDKTLIKILQGPVYSWFDSQVTIF